MIKIVSIFLLITFAFAEKDILYLFDKEKVEKIKMLPKNFTSQDNFSNFLKSKKEKSKERKKFLFLIEESFDKSLVLKQNDIRELKEFDKNLILADIASLDKKLIINKKEYPIPLISKYFIKTVDENHILSIDKFKKRWGLDKFSNKELILSTLAISYDDLELKENHNTYSIIGDSFAIQSYQSKAIKYYKKALKFEPKNLNTIYSLARAYALNREYKNAIEYLNRAKAIESDKWQIYNGLTTLYKIEKNYKKVIDTLKEALDKVAEISKVGIYKKIVQIYEKDLKDYDNTVLYYKELLKLNPNDLDSMKNLGIFYRKNREYKKATDILKKSIKQHKDFVDGYNELAITYNYQKKHKVALGYLLKAKNIDPNKVDTYNNLAYVYSDLNQYDKVIEMAKKSLEFSPYNYLAMLTLFEASLVQNEKFDKVIEKRYIETYKSSVNKIYKYKMLKALENIKNRVDESEFLKLWKNNNLSSIIMNSWSFIPIKRWIEFSDFSKKIKNRLRYAVEVFEGKR